MNQQYRNKVKQMKEEMRISYKSISDEMGIHQNSFRNWLNNQYDFTFERLMELKQILNRLEEQK